MASDYRNTANNIAKSINWPSYSFEQAVRIIESIDSPDTDTFGSEISYKDTRIKLKPEVLFHVPATEVICCKFDNDDEKFLLSCNRLTFEGVLGPLPLSYSDLISLRLGKKDRAAAEFVSIFHLRILGISYRLSKKRFPSLNGKKQAESFLGKIISSLLGNKQNLLTNVLMPYHLTLWRRARNITGLLEIIESYFSWPIAVQECVGGWTDGNPDQISRIGCVSGNWNVLGKGMMIGHRTWDQSKSINLDLGPTDYDSYKSIVIENSILKRIAMFIRHYCGVMTSVKLRIITQISQDQLQKEKIHLGLNSWLISTKNTERLVFSNYIKL